VLGQRRAEGEDVTDLMEWTAVAVGALSVLLEGIFLVRDLHVARRQMSVSRHLVIEY
jgi:hypothetical protein